MSILRILFPSVFTRKVAADPITIVWIQPVGIEIYEAGGNAEIIWTTNSTALTLELYYSDDDGVNWNLVEEIPNLGNGIWNVDLGETVVGRLKLVDVASGASAVSENFEITLPA